MLFVGWIAVLLGVLTTVCSPYEQNACLAAWSLFVLFTLYSLTAAILTENARRYSWIACSVFSIGALVAITHSEYTLGSALSGFAVGDPNQFEPGSDRFYAQVASRMIAMDVIDLAWASILSFVGWNIGSTIHQRKQLNLSSRNGG